MQIIIAIFLLCQVVLQMIKEYKEGSEVFAIIVLQVTYSFINFLDYLSCLLSQVIQADFRQAMVKPLACRQSITGHIETNNFKASVHLKRVFWECGRIPVRFTWRCSKGDFEIGSHQEYGVYVRTVFSTVQHRQ